MSHVFQYTCTTPTPIYESPHDHNRVADHGRANLRIGETFRGRPDGNNHVWIGTGIGFVPDNTVMPSFEYEVVETTPIYQDHREGSPIAQGGTARLMRGEIFVGTRPVAGWIWNTTGIGFVPEGVLKANTQIHIVQPGDNLSLISQRVYGTQDYWEVIYQANKAVIGPNPNFLQPAQALYIPHTF